MTTTLEATSHMVSYADQALADLEKQLAEQEQRLQVSEAELVTLAQAKADRAQQVSEARTHAERLTSDHFQAHGYATLAVGTPKEREASRSAATAKKAMQAATKEAERLASEQTQADQDAATREQELQAQCEALRVEIRDTRTKLTAIEAGRAQAHTELGEQTYTDLLPGYKERRARVDDLRAQLAAAQIELQGYHMAGVEQLAPWQDIQTRFQALEGIDDSTSRFLEATLHYVDATLQDIDSVNMDFPGGSYNPWELLFIPHQIMRGAPGHLRERRDQIRLVLERYQAYKAGKAF